MTLGDQQIGEIAVVLVTSGLIAGMIAFQRIGGGGTFVGFFLFGALLPIIGIIAACLAKGPPKAPGWYPDPWKQAVGRYHDERGWTHHISNGEEPPAS